MPIKTGRKPKLPTDEQRKFVQGLISYGATQDEICTFLTITKPTLHKHYRRELDIGMLYANAMVGQTAYKMATSGKSPALTIFWAKSRMGWTEKTALELTGRNGGPIETATAPVDPIEAARIYQRMMDGE